MQQMSSLRYRTLWLTLGWLQITAVWVLYLMPSPPSVDIGIDFLDKLVHFATYAMLMGWFIQLYPHTRTRLFYAVGFIGMGMTIEILQGMGKARMFEAADILANSLGVVLISSIMHTRVNQILFTLEQQFIKYLRKN